jgi:acyl carrier protein
MSVAEAVRDYIRRNFLFGSDEQLGENESLLDRGIIDSTGAMELVTFIESHFGIEVSDQDLVPENLDSIAAITAFVSRALQNQNPAGLAAAAS